MNETELVTIIIPMFNAENYVADCMNNVLNQNYKNLEIIIVDDGSTDSTYELCLKYANMDDRIQIFRQHNEGVSAARNAGIHRANGKYITFLDCDDIIYPEYIQYLVQLIIKYDSDISICSLQKKASSFRNEINMPQGREVIKVYNQQEALRDLLYRKCITGHSFAKLIKTEIVKKNLFICGVGHREDRWFLLRLLENCKSIIYSSKILYFYLQNLNSVTHNINWDMYIRDWHIITKAILLEIDQKYPDLINAAIADEFIYTLDSYKQVFFNKQYNEFRNCLYDFLVRYRKVVLKDHKCKKSNRILAFSCCISIKLTIYLCLIIEKLFKIFKIQINYSI